MWLALVLACRSCAPPQELPPPPPPPAPRPPGAPVPAWSAASCREDELSIEVRRAAVRPNGSRFLRLDVDRDGNADLLDLHLEGPRPTVVVRLTRHGPRRLRLAWEVPEGSAHAVVAVPPDLTPDDRALLEHLAFPRVCPTPDAALRTALEGDAAPWVEGPPVDPLDYAWEDGARWVLFSGALFDGAFVEVAREGDVGLRVSDRAVVAVRPDAHRWVHLEGGTGRVKGARLAGPDAVDVDVEPLPGAPVQVVRHPL